MDSMSGMREALEQSESLTNQTISENQYLQNQENVKISDYKAGLGLDAQALTNLEGKDKGKDSTNLQQIGGQVIDGVDKMKKYKTAIESGEWKGTYDNLSSGVKKVSSAFGGGEGGARTSARRRLIAEEDFGGDVRVSDPATPEEDDAPVDNAVDDGGDSTGDTAPDPPSDDSPPSVEDVAPDEEVEGGEDEDTTETGEGEGNTNSGTPEETATEDTGGGSTEESTEDTGGGSTEESTEGATEGGGDSTGGAIEDVATDSKSTLQRVGGVALEGASRVFTGAMGGAMLGDDIYNQISSHKFFYGDNTGDKIGHFTNEIGSALDVGGALTGDPFLVALGVGVGAVGSVVSDISELFGHSTSEDALKNKKPPPKPPPNAVEVANKSIGASGEIAQSQQSSLRSVSVGGY